MLRVGCVAVLLVAVNPGEHWHHDGLCPISHITTGFVFVWPTCVLLTF